MTHPNITFVQPLTFAVTPSTPAEEFENLCNMLIRNQPVDFTSDGQAVTSGSAADSRTASSRDGQTNISIATSSASRFAGDGLPFSPPEIPEGYADNVRLTAENLIDTNVSGSSVRSSAASAAHDSRSDGVNISTASAERFAATVWYNNPRKLTNTVTGKSFGITGKELYDAEVAAMMKQYPQAKIGTMETTGEKYWVVKFNVFNGTENIPWTIMLKYDNTHPHAQNWGGSVKARPMSPKISELRERAAAAGRGYVPHIVNDDNDKMEYLCTIGIEEQKEMQKKGKIQSAAAVCLRAIRWAQSYEIGINTGVKNSDAVWKNFIKSHNEPI